MNTRSRLGLLPLFGGLLSAGCSGHSADANSGFDSGCSPPAGGVLTKSQVDAAIAGVKGLLAGKLSFESDPSVVRVLTDSRRADLIVASILCTAEKRGDITSTDGSSAEYTRKLFLYTWGTSPAPGPEDVQTWTMSHPFSHVTADPTPSATAAPFAAERFDAIDSAAETCTHHTVPAGVPVCVRLTGDPAVGLYAAEAHDHGLLLTSMHPGQPASWFKQNIDYAVCVRPTSKAQQSAVPHGPMTLEIESRPREQCLGAPATTNSTQPGDSGGGG